MIIRDANRTRHCSRCSPDTQVQIVQNGARTERYTSDLAPLDFYHIEHGSVGTSVVTKKPGSELESIDLTRHGLISDHIAGRYVAWLRAGLMQRALDDRLPLKPRRIGAALFERPGLRRRKLDPPLQVAGI
jgi:hypothetical protein